MFDEVVKVFLSDQLLEIVQEVEALLVRHCAEGIIGIFAIEVDNELGEVLPLFSIVIDGVA